jgi:CheY-like chemotaxis protein
MSKILVVDDEPLILDMITSLLSGCGHEVRTCHMWPSVASAVKEHKPDLVLLDYNMPGLRGDEICTILKRSTCGMTKIVLFSSESESDLTRIVGECGADGYIKKNRPAAVLLREINDAMAVA